MILVGSAAWAVPPEEVARREEQRLAGTWRVIAAEAGGVAVPPKEYRELRLTFKDGKFTARRGDEAPEAGTYKLDPSRDPRGMDIVRRIGGREVVQKGVYSLNGSLLKICASVEERPEGFDTRDRPDRTFLTLRRVD
jgi:uncharacterized protein (TIGR03067 family)